MNILFVLTAPVFGGAEKYVADLAFHLHSRGHDVTIACNSFLVPHNERPGVRVLRIPIGPKLARRNLAQVLLFPLLFCYLVVLFFRLKSKYRIELIHCQFKKEQALVSAAARCANIPVVWTEHAPFPSIIAKRPALVACYRLAARLSRKIIAVSEATRRDLLRNGIPASKVVRIYNGIPIDSSDQKEADVASRVVLSIGQLSPGKGHAFLIEAFKKIVSEFPDAVLRIAGDGALRQQLEALAAAKGLERSVHFLGLISHEAVLRNIERSAVVVMPSLPTLGGEGLPYAVLEAMERARPVVATRSGGIPELVEDGETGYLIDDADPELIAPAILRLLGDPELARRLGAKGREKAVDCFSLSSWVASTEAVFAGVHQSPGRSGSADPNTAQ